MLSEMKGSFDIEEIKEGAREFLIGEVLDRMDEHTSATMFGFYHPGEDRCFLLTLKAGAMEETCSGKQPKVLQDLDVVILSDLVVECLLGISHEQCEDEGLMSYFADPDAALDVAVKESTGDNNRDCVLFLMNATKVGQVKKIADKDLIMPHKSTYFYPKVLTGLLLNKIVPAEKLGEK